MELIHFLWIVVAINTALIIYFYYLYMGVIAHVESFMDEICDHIKKTRIHVSNMMGHIEKINENIIDPIIYYSVKFIHTFLIIL